MAAVAPARQRLGVRQSSAAFGSGSTKRAFTLRLHFPQRGAEFVTGEISSYPSSEPFPRLSLHLRVELVRRVVEARAALLRRASLLVTCVELVEAGVHASEVEQSVL